MSDYTERMALARQALSEGCCPLCGGRLSPFPPDEGFDLAGMCASHGLLQANETYWDQIHPAVLAQRFGVPGE